MTNARNLLRCAGAVVDIESLAGQRDDTSAVRADSTHAAFSVLTASEPRIVSKRFELKDGVLQKSTVAAISRGQIDRVEVGSLAEFAEVLQRLTASQALVFGVHPAQTIELVTERSWHDHGCPPGETSRTKANFAYPRGPGVMMLDYDPAPDSPPLSCEELVARIRQAVPALAEIRMLWMPSAGSCIFNEETAEELKGVRGQRLYFLVADAADIPRAGAVLFDRLWLIGCGRFDVSAAGSLLDRTDVDGSVWSPERIDFAAGADCRAPLVQRRGYPQVIDGCVEVVDTYSAFPSLSAEEREHLDNLKTFARAVAQPRALAVQSARRNAYVAYRAAQAAETGMDDQEVRETAAAEFDRIHEVRELPPDWVLQVFPDGIRRDVTVREVLDHRAEFNCAECLDPIEPEYGASPGNSLGRKVGILYLLDQNAVLYSQAHGGQTYRLETTPVPIVSSTRAGVPGVLAVGDWPDPKPFAADVLLPVPPFDPNLLPGALRPWVVDEAARIPVAPDFVAAFALVLLASVVGARCGIHPKARDSWAVIPNLWGAGVGSVSSGKSPSADSALRPLDRLIARAKAEGAEAAADFEAAEMVHEVRLQQERAKLKGNASRQPRELEAAARDILALKGAAPKPPTPRRYLSNDTTVETLGELIAENPNGMLVFRDELTGLLESFEKQGREGDRAFYLEAWNGNRPYYVDRIGRGRIEISNLCASVLGGIQPDKLRGYLELTAKGSGNDGFLQRFQVLVFPDPVPAVYQDRAPDAGALAMAFDVFDRLSVFDPMDYGATLLDEHAKRPTVGAHAKLTISAR